MSKLQEAFDVHEFRKKGHQLIDQLADYLEQSMTRREGTVLLWRTPEDAYDDWKSYLSEDHSTNDFHQKIIDTAMHLHHPHYMGHQVALPVPEAILSNILVGALKNGSGLYEMAPMASTMTKVVMEFLAEQIGFGDQADGFITSGGTLANLTALLTARQVKGHGDIWNEGNPKNQLAVMVSEEAHYCVDRAIRIMGLGAEGLVKIPTNNKFQVDISKLESTYNNAVTNGKIIFAIVGNACSTSVGAYDNLKAMADFAEEKKLWFHVDGAHGGAAIFSKKYKNLVKGIERADSVIIDGHKMMLTAGLITALIYKDGKNSYRTFHQKAHYLWENNQEEWFNNTKRTFECTKFANVIELYAMIKNHGNRLFAEYVTYTYDLAKILAEKLEATAKFEVAHQPESNILCFRIFDREKNNQELNALNASIRKQLTHEGDFYIVQTMIDGEIYLRVSLMNPFTTTEILDQLITRILEIKTASISRLAST
ncbi:MAG: aminotransferase class I/II-fold pyridoxal phosphate-dependent enzyme [Bacteroidota bacterium]